jgi:hypothetical protein
MFHYLNPKRLGLSQCCLAPSPGRADIDYATVQALPGVVGIKRFEELTFIDLGRECEALGDVETLSAAWTRLCKVSKGIRQRTTITILFVYRLRRPRLRTPV